MSPRVTHSIQQKWMTEGSPHSRGGDLDSTSCRKAWQMIFRCVLKSSEFLQSPCTINPQRKQNRGSGARAMLPRMHVSREPGLQMTPDLDLLQGPAEWENRVTIKQDHHPSGFGLSGQMLWSHSKSLISPEDQCHPIFAIFCTARGSGQKKLLTPW